MARYQVLEDSFIENKMVKAGTVIEYDLPKPSGTLDDGSTKVDSIAGANLKLLKTGEKPAPIPSPDDAEGV